MNEIISGQVLFFSGNYSDKIVEHACLMSSISEKLGI